MRGSDESLSTDLPGAHDTAGDGCLSNGWILARKSTKTSVVYDKSEGWLKEK